MARKARSKPKSEDNQPDEGATAAAETGNQPQQAGAHEAPAAQDARGPSDAGAAQTGAVPTEPEGGEVKAIVVVGPRQGRRRAGRRFTPEPVTIPLEELSLRELAALRADPLLNVSGD
ncbi:hypothetical protein QO034_06555 [Sedimentitalea sp. JM2-8]|uniref:Mu-like prophage FluMu N-terminal domain-containing protein n=1 Tax=Sedimentitalea xiamensis TaxID=3050037 RepID=A0ABT7FCH8_9RHOB|nr:hypothetical protein [Sedimentitalea xiamensis]MDK3072765.1 hypothetical protein [Sedimentitalea xiamensis]